MSRMECTQIDDLLMDYLYQELAPEQAAEFRAHLDSCDRCAREVQSFQGVREAVRELPVLEPPKGLTAQLLHQAAAAKQPAFPWLQKLWELLQPRRTFYAVAAAASLVVVLFVGYALQKGNLKATFPAEERAVATAEAPAAPATPSAPRAVAAGDELKGAESSAKSAAGGEPLDRAANTLAESDGKLVAGKGTAGIPVRLDNESVQREKAAGVDPGWDSSNMARAAGARRTGYGLGGRIEEPKDQSVQRETKQALDGDGRGFAVVPKAQAPVQTRMPQGVARGAQAAPILNAPAGGPAAGPQRVQLTAPPAPAAAQAPPPAEVQTAKRGWQAPAPQAAPPPAPAKEEAEAGYYRRQGAAGKTAPEAPAPDQQRRGEPSLGNADENARDKGGDGRGFAQAPPDERTRMRANVDYKNAMGVECEKQIKLLEGFIAKYPWDNRVKEAKIRIAVCRARLTGQSDDIDAELRTMERNRQKKSLTEAEQRAAPDRYAPARKAPAPVSLERQTSYKLKKGGAKPAVQHRAPAKADSVQQASKAPPRAPDAKPVAKAKAPAKAPAAKAAAPAAKPAAPAATAAKTKKAAPAKADEKSKSRPAAAESSK
jgi:anti-sigma factor RsiW